VYYNDVVNQKTLKKKKEREEERKKLIFILFIILVSYKNSFVVGNYDVFIILS
jgi:hypothetical protein